MTFTFFSALFLAGAVLLYYLLPARAYRVRPYLLLALSIIFLLHFYPKAVPGVLGASVLIWAFGLLSGKEALHARRTSFAAIGILFLAVLLALYKILISHPALYQNSGPLFRLAPAAKLLTAQVGISYYLFQGIAYLADVRTGRVRPERNFFYLLLYLSFFPRFVSGPIERPAAFIGQLTDRRAIRLVRPDDEFPEGGRLSAALSAITVGWFMKIFLADRLSAYTAAVFASPKGRSGALLLVCSLLYTVQLYCDFAGYSSVAVGTAQLFGIRLTQNFHAPYLSAGSSEFWRRWHISLSSWLRDYIYIPLGGSRSGLGKKIRNTFAVFLVCGLWHGIGSGFLVWGLLHAAFASLESALKGKIHLPLVLRRILTFCYVSAAWIFFGTKNVRTAVTYFAGILAPSGWSAQAGWALQALRQNTAGTAGLGSALHAEFVQFGFTESPVILISLGIVLMIAADAVSYRHGKPFAELAASLPFPARYLFLALAWLILLIFGSYGAGYRASSFLYSQF